MVVLWITYYCSAFTSTISSKSAPALLQQCTAQHSTGPISILTRTTQTFVCHQAEWNNSSNRWSLHYTYESVLHNSIIRTALGHNTLQHPWYCKHANRLGWVKLLTGQYETYFVLILSVRHISIFCIYIVLTKLRLIPTLNILTVLIVSKFLDFQIGVAPWWIAVDRRKM